MSDIGKHVFEVSVWGTLWYRGRVASETEKTWMVTRDGNKPSRVFKGGSFVAAQDEEAGDRAKAAYKAHNDRCLELEDAARKARAEQREAMFAALRGEGE